MTTSRATAKDLGATAWAWVTADRVRLFGAVAGVLVLVSLVCLVIGNPLFDMLAGMAALIAAASALVAVLTWVAGRSGDTDVRDPWDRDAAAGSAPEDVFRGFSGFQEDRQ